MNSLVQLFEAIALLVPDFLTLGLVAPTFFSLYDIAKSLGLAGTVGIGSALRISLILGYLVTVAISADANATAASPGRDTWYEFLLKQFNRRHLDYRAWFEKRRHAFLGSTVAKAYFW